MADSKRLTILKRITTHLMSDVSVANGYQHDLAGRVFRGRMTFGDEESLPCVSILESLNPDRDAKESNARPGHQTERWVLMVQGWVKDDRENPTDPAHNLMADVKKSLGKIITSYRVNTPVFLLGGLITNGRIEPGTVRPPDEVSSRAYFYVRFVLDLHEDTADPYRIN